MKYLISFCVFFLIGYCTSFLQEATYYTRYDCTGQSITVNSKVPNLQGLGGDIVTYHKSRAFLGRWQAYSTHNFVGKYWTGGDLHETKTCYNGSGVEYGGSVRFLGPMDTETESITLYKGTNFVETELIIDRPAHAFVEFNPQSFIISPRTNWTLYSGENFDGNAICVSSGNDFVLERLASDALSQNMKSILQGCDGRINEYLSL